MIAVKNLTKVYKVPRQDYRRSLRNFFWPPTEEKVGVDQISFSIEQGEMVGFVGPNGAGKTTTIKMLAGILTPTAGELEVAGFVPYRERKRYTREFGVLMGQRSVLFYDIPVMESLKFFKDVYALSDAEFTERLGFFAEQLEIAPLLKVPVRKLSLGQRMRCEIVASMLHNPKILFLDEPTIGLDIIAKQKIIEFLGLLNAEFKTTIFLTTHDLNDIDRLCQRIIILDQGRIRYDGGIRNIQSRDRFKIIEVAHGAEFDAQALVAKFRRAFAEGTVVVKAVGQDGVKAGILPEACLDDAGASLVNRFEVLSTDASKTRIKVAKEDLALAINLVNGEDILDLNINLITLEEVIREMYAGG